MTRTKATEPKKKVKPLSDAEVFALAAGYENASKTEADAKKTKTETAKQIISELFTRRKVSSVESSQFGPFTRITVSQAKHMEYDEDGLWKDMTPAQRREAFDTLVNLNALPTDVRKAVIAALPAIERRKVTTHRLNLDKLSLAVQNKKVPAKLVAKHAEEVKNAPYITISHGSGK